ncbi:hypothetical protein AJ87_08510 [Rhizobium yanglingense]|nr:hypothetical protein AJ87_08510 [Rhizobium yanglingense]
MVNRLEAICQTYIGIQNKGYISNGIRVRLGRSCSMKYFRMRLIDNLSIGIFRCGNSNNIVVV